MKYLITGGAGFIGSQLADFLLDKGHDVVVFDNLSWGKKEFIQHNLSNPRYSFVKLDLLDSKTLEKQMPTDIDIVYHLAANSDIMRGTTDPGIDFKNTTEATFHLLNAMRLKGIKKIVYTSGSGVYGDVGATVTTESFGPLLPISMYGATKLSAEGMISSFVNLYDMQGWILRPANIIGPRATHGVVLDFINRLKDDPTTLHILGDGLQSKSYLYVTDVLEAMHLLPQKVKDPISVFNIASNSFITVNEIAVLVIGEMNLPEVRLIHSKGNRGWKGDVPIVRISNAKIKKLGWKSRHTSRQAVIKTIKNILGKTK
jgi:UDP-glucose 4-epimerase